MRKLTVTVFADGRVSANDEKLGYGGEHNAVELSVSFNSEALKIYSLCDYFRVVIDGQYSEELRITNGGFKYSVPEACMQPPKVNFQIAGYKIQNGEPIAIIKSEIFEFKVDRSEAAWERVEANPDILEKTLAKCAESAQTAVAGAEVASDSATAALLSATEAKQAADNAAEAAADRAVENVNSFFYRTAPIAVGTILPFAGVTPPDTFMLCDGTALSKLEYPELFKVIGYAYGGSGNVFKLPNLNGRTVVGLNSADSDFNALGKVGGEKHHTLTIPEMPLHSHLQGAGDDANNYLVNNSSGNLGGFKHAFESTEYVGGKAAVSTFDAGANYPHNNMQPYAVVNFVIKVTQQSNAKREFDEELAQLELALSQVDNLYAAVEKVDNKAVITMTNKDGEVYTAEVFDGEKGDKGDKGEKGDKGDLGEQGEKGDSYVLTAADKQDIASLVSDLIINPLEALIDDSGVFE